MAVPAVLIACLLFLHPRQGAHIGDVFVSSAKVHHDRRIPIPGFDAYGEGKIHSLATPALRAACGLKLGIVSSGNSLDYTDKCMEAMTGAGVAVKEMEAAAVGWVSGGGCQGVLEARMCLMMRCSDFCTFLPPLNRQAASAVRLCVVR